MPARNGQRCDQRPLHRALCRPSAAHERRRLLARELQPLDADARFECGNRIRRPPARRERLLIWFGRGKSEQLAEGGRHRRRRPERFSRDGGEEVEQNQEVRLPVERRMMRREKHGAPRRRME